MEQDQRDDEQRDEWVEDDDRRPHRPDRGRFQRNGAIVAIVVGIILLILGVIFWFTAGHKPTDRELTSVMHDEHVGEPNHSPSVVTWITGGFVLVAGLVLLADVRQREVEADEDDDEVRRRQRPRAEDPDERAARSIPPGTGPTGWR